MTNARPLFSLAIALALASALGGCKTSSSRVNGREACTPGDTLIVGCSQGCGIGRCTGDPVLTVCDGSVSVPDCVAGSAVIGSNDDDGCGADARLCSRTTVTCPSSGAITVVHRAYSSSGSYTCSWEVQSAGTPGI